MRMKWEDVTRDDLVAAMADCKTHTQILRYLNFSPAAKNYQSLEKIAANHGVELPEKIATRPSGSKSFDEILDAPADVIRSAFEKTGNLSETLVQLGVKENKWTREKLRNKLTSMGVDHSQTYTSKTTILERINPAPHPYKNGKDSTIVKGSIAELAITAALAKAGFTVLTPLSVVRYDLAIDTSEGIKTVQCKHSVMQGDKIKFFAVSNDPSTKIRRRYHDEVDFYGVWSPELDKSYLIPTSDITDTPNRIILNAGSKYRQLAGLRFASDYEI